MKQLFKIDRSSSRALLAVEWVVLAYMAFTIILIFFTYTTHTNPLALIGGRMQILAMMGGLWLVHYWLPCQFTLFLRVLLQAALLSWWYPDTYELNKVLPNLDPTFAGIDQNIFGCQPALLLHTILPSWMSEPLHMGYYSYYLFIAVTLIYYLFWQREDFLRASFVLLTAFFAFYVIFDLIPVTGPIYYYEYAGLDSIREGLFPDAGDHFMNSQACLTMPGDKDGFFYHLVEGAHHAGERPTAAFPSSHVGCCAVMELLLLFSRKWKLSLILLPFFILMSIATVYIQAHYAIDAIVGLFVGTSFYFIFNTLYKKLRLW
ncbi:MAG: phosphatase PAP2 family protein [Bacteroidaceae bacterium]|nr:phosphatase PAP2 family protein [Bacteroidaceae bacterium]